MDSYLLALKWITLGGAIGMIILVIAFFMSEYGKFKMEKQLIIVRGLPGCGKSTFSEMISTDVCTPDDYRMINGKYRWTIENDISAHIESQKKCERLMRSDTKRICVSAVLCTMDDMLPYYEMAEMYGYKVFSIIVENRHNSVNGHDVPDEKIQTMKDHFDIKL